MRLLDVFVDGLRISAKSDEQPAPPRRRATTPKRSPRRPAR